MDIKKKRRTKKEMLNIINRTDIITLTGERYSEMCMHEERRYYYERMVDDLAAKNHKLREKLKEYEKGDKENTGDE